MKKYSNYKMEFSLLYPASWHKIEHRPTPDEGILFTVLFQRDRPKVPTTLEEAYSSQAQALEIPNLNVQIVPWEGSLEHFVDQSMNSMRSEEDRFKDMKSSEVQLDGRKAKSHVFRLEHQESHISKPKILHIYAIYEKKAYVITYYALEKDFDEYHPIIETSIKSFRFLQKYQVIDLLELCPYSFPEHGFQISLPNSWTKLQSIQQFKSPPTVFVAESHWSASGVSLELLLVIDSIDRSTSLEDYAKIHAQHLSKQLQLSELPVVKETRLSSLPALSIFYENPSNKMKTLRLFTVSKGFAYVLTFQSNSVSSPYDKREECLFPRIAKSFRLNSMGTLAPQKQKNFAWFEDVSKGYGISYGDPYKYQPSVDVATFVKQDSSSVIPPTVTVITSADVEEPSLKDFYEEFRKQTGQTQGYEESTKCRVRVDFDHYPSLTEIEALEIRTQEDIPTEFGTNISLKSIQRFALHKGRGYILAFISPEAQFDREYANNVQKMFDSFQLFDPFIINED